MAVLQYDIRDLPLNLRTHLKTEECRRERVQFELAQIRQRHLANFFHLNRPRSVEGVGEQYLIADRFWSTYFQKRGIDYWGDPDFTKWLLKRHEEFRVRSTGTKTQVGYGTCWQRMPKKFSKTFPAEAPATGESKRSEQEEQAHIV